MDTARQTKWFRRCFKRRGWASSATLRATSSAHGEARPPRATRVAPPPEYFRKKEHYWLQIGQVSRLLVFNFRVSP